MHLPIFLNQRNKYFYCVLGSLVGAFLYIAANRLLLFPAHLLPLSPVDSAIPFIPQTVWIYNSDVILFFAAYILSRDMANLSRYLYALFAVLMISVTVFFLWPTTYPRDLFPLPAESLDSWTALVFNHLRKVDAPTNCFPSLHVSVSYLSAFIFLGEQRRKFPFFFIWQPSSPPLRSPPSSTTCSMWEQAFFFRWWPTLSFAAYCTGP